MNERTIFLEALEQPSPERRTEFLHQACGNDTELIRKVEQLIQAHNDAGSFIEHSPVDDAVSSANQKELHAESPTGQFPDGGASTPPLDSKLPFLSPSISASHLGKLGHYEVLEVIGRGAFGIVLRALDPKLNRIVAIKVLSPAFAENAMSVRRFLKEAQAAAAVSHDHVVTIHAVDEANGVPFLVMECIVGQSLQQKIDRQGALPIAEILRIGMQIASGLAAAHKQGLVHRDIKPANILLENGIQRVKITDFGLARATDELAATQTFQVAGTPQYMSPEQAHGDLIDQRSDLFSLGSVLYTLCTGRAAFRADSILGILKRVCDDAPRPIGEVNPEVPKWLCDTVHRLLAKKPEDRIQTAAEVADLLREYLAELQMPTGRVVRSPMAANTNQVTPAPHVSLPVKPRFRWSTLLWVLVTVPVVSGGLMIGIWLASASSRERFTTPTQPPAFKSEDLSVLTIELNDPQIEFRIDDSGQNRTGVAHYQIPVTPGVHQVWFKLGARELRTAPFSVSAHQTGRLGINFASDSFQATWQDQPLGLTTVSGESPAEYRPAPMTPGFPFNSQQARESQMAWARYLLLPVQYSNSQQMAFRLIPPGQYLRGTSSREVERLLADFPELKSDTVTAQKIQGESPAQNANVAEPFYLAASELTVGQFRKFVAATRYQTQAESNGGGLSFNVSSKVWEKKPENIWSHPQFAISDDHPVVFLTLQDAIFYCGWLSDQDGHGTYFVPTNEQWEFASRAGSAGRWHFGDDASLMKKFGWTLPHSETHSHPCGRLIPNPYGLFDIYGNVSEITTNKSGQSFERGGSSYLTPAESRSATIGTLDKAGESTSYRGIRIGMIIPNAGKVSGEALSHPPLAVAPFSEVAAHDHQSAWQNHLGLPVTYTNAVSMPLRLIPPGKFQMGSTDAEAADLVRQLDQQGGSDFDKFVATSAGPRHDVEISRPFYMSQYEVTVEQFQKFTEETGYVPSAEKSGDAKFTWKSFMPTSDLEKQPVCGVSWDDAHAYCVWLTERCKNDQFNITYDLPTEAQWEYACRAGSDLLWSFGDEEGILEEFAVYGQKGIPLPSHVGIRRQNAFGLFDMHGNVDEWCRDWHNRDAYTRLPSIDPILLDKPSDAASGRVARGGSWNADAWWSRAATRTYDFSAKPTQAKGFRVAGQILP